MAQRGEIWLVDFGEPIGHEQGYRPALIISADQLNRSRAELIIVLPVTSTRRRLPSHIEIEPDESGLNHTTYAKAEDIKSVSTRRLVRRLGSAPIDRVHRAEHALRLLLGL
ncbi:type II toxin-antitoxin system PemK/MazF family toxin [Allosaccharopolyspora coralli]|uniref:mRNA interferase n=1 Tax=Allosaccharopolyspora coralli TaxID=2665642 RepID=A0A5Q3Q1S2_9PSEU|nr:type II toxin-antitoxin system PemK/MazF family toxin [Allosaccharopolyspora coralli]QGK68283.1 type II toxin-antitoxin system PemK/MazF family toxin [Allosaccharopolyspora coralli]